ncbi:MAG: hypothetical protein AAF629_18905 [Chloroflexota bacterium]
MPNIAAELVLRYDPTDYRGVVTEYLSLREKYKGTEIVKPVIAGDA